MHAPPEVEVWIAAPGPLVARLRAAGAADALDDEDRAHVARFRQAVHRELALASRLLQRRAIAARAGVGPAVLRFAREAGGRPRVVAPAAACPIAFSAANTAGLVACAVCDRGPLGLDVEPREAALPADLVEGTLTGAERAALLALPEAARGARFRQLWTLKEAYLKATGRGIDAPLDRIGFVLDAGAPRGDPAAIDPGPAAWRFHDIDADPAYRISLCTAWPVALRVHRATP
jgi:4'-phosphopantetheinyl transferase